MPSFFSDGNTPSRRDGPWVIEQKILGALNEIASVSGMSVVYGGVADPNAGVISPPDTTKPTLYFQDLAGHDEIQMWRWSVADQVWKAVITT